MNLDEAQRKKVSGWIAEGLKLSDIQKRLENEFGLRLTYLEMRLLMNDLQLAPKDEDRKTAAAATTIAAQAPPAAPAGKVSVSVDNVTRAGALVSGKVTFTDGQSAEWFLDQMGRLGFVPKQQGYRPSPEDLETFQTELQAQLQKLGY